MDPVAMYLALGAALRDRAQTGARDAEAAVKDADAQVADAEALLVDARREAVVARQRLDKAKALALELGRGVL